ncbi:hypothetical protein BsWGS_12041 [Bradybaena similaris]
MTVNVFLVFLLLAATGVLSQPGSSPPLDPCFGTFCQNGGNCIQPQNVAICQCRSGFGGDRCQNVVPVKIGTCIDENTGPLNCTRGCDNDYDCLGSKKCCNTRCERQCTNKFVIDPCARFGCLNGGFCVAPADAPECRCPSGFSGEKCQNVDGYPGTCRRPTPYKKCYVGSPCVSDRQCKGGNKCCLNGCGRKVCTSVV